jgi:DNA-binding YbaB/EbfC family protein
MKARLPQGMGKGPSNNMNQMLKQAQQMQDKITDLQADLEQREFTGTAGGGVVEVVINGKRNVLKLEIKPEVVDPNDVEMLQDLIMSAFNQAVETLDKTSDEEMKALTGGVSFPGLFWYVRIKRFAAGAAHRAVRQAARHRYEIGAETRLSRYVYAAAGGSGFC